VKSLVTQFKKLVADIVGISTSRDQLKALWRNPLYSNALYILTAHLATAVFGFVFWVMAARFYSAGDVGLASALISAMNLLSIVSGLGFGYGLIRFLGASKEPVALINSSFTIVGSVSAAAGVIFILGTGLWSPALVYARTNHIYLLIFVLAVSAAAVSGIADNTFIAKRMAGYMLARNIAFNVSRLVLPVVLAAPLESFGIFASWGAAASVSLLLGVVVFLPRAQSGYRLSLSLDRKAVGGMFRFSFENYLSDVFWLAPILILQSVVVVNLLGSESNAYFAVAWAMGGILNAIPAAVSMSLLAEGSHDEEGLEQSFWRSLKMTFLILIPAVILVSVPADKLLLLFGSEYSQNAATLLRLLAVSAFPLALNYLYFGTKRVEKRLRVVIYLIVLAGAITVGLSYLLMPHMGITGAGVAWLVCQTLIALVVVIQWLVKRRAGQGHSLSG
jgi:O-antigen/teichoic acid export membrane protein